MKSEHSSTSFSPVLDGVDIGEDLSRVPRVHSRIAGSAPARAVVREVFEYFDAVGSGTVYVPER